MRANVSPSKLGGAACVVTSKSYYIRALILAALSDAPVKLLGTNECDDVKAAISAIERLGATVEKTDKGYTVTPVKVWPDKAEVNVGESATLLRILVPVLAAKGVECVVYAEDSLKKRPVRSLVKPLADHGVKFTRTSFPLKFSGRLTAGRYCILDTTTSGVVSGLAIALSALDGDSEIVADIDSFNKGYINITIDILSAFGQVVGVENKCLKIKGNAKLGVSEYKVEEDWSNAAAWLVGGALVGEVSVKGLSLISEQYDRMIVEYLSRMGAEISMSEKAVTVKKSNLCAITADMSKNVDIVPVLAVAAAAAEGVTVLENIERLALKESNRIDEIIKLLDNVSVKAEYANGNLIIHGGELKTKGTYAAPKDHRIIMAATLLGAVVGMEIENVDGISKSYPKFFKDFIKLGGKVICQ